MPRSKRRRHNNPVARHHGRRRKNPHRGRHRSRVRINHHHRRRRNPGFGGTGSTLFRAVKHTGVIVIAQAVVNKVSQMIPFGAAGGPAQIIKQVVVGLGLYQLARKFAPKVAEDVLIGAFLAPVTTGLRMVPGVGTALAGAPPGLGRMGLWNPVNVRTLRGAPPGLGRFEGGTVGGPGRGALPDASYYN